MALVACDLLTPHISPAIWTGTSVVAEAAGLPDAACKAFEIVGSAEDLFAH
jgi:hypothetical protein